MVWASCDGSPSCPTRSCTAIPLHGLDLTQADQQAVLSCLQTLNGGQESPDQQLLQAWEAAWAQLWDRPALAFADPAELIQTIKHTLGWPSGLVIRSDPLVDPAWQEGCAAAWLTLTYQDIDPYRGQPGSEESSEPVHMIHHFQGFPNFQKKKNAFLLEDVSALLKPFFQPQGDLLLIILDGNRMVKAGGTCVVLSQDGDLIQAMARQRRRPPWAAACALGLSQLQRLEELLAQRERLAQRYLTMRPRGIFQLPVTPATGRRWEGFLLTFSEPLLRESLRIFLEKAGIGCAAPVWFNPPGNFPVVTALQTHTLALPLYASLSDPQQKRIINRIHRWVERNFSNKELVANP